MRIVSAEIAAVAAPFPEPLLFGRQPMTTNTAVVVHLEEADGLIGFGYAPTFGFGTKAVLSHVEDDFAPGLLRVDLGSANDAVTMMNDMAVISGRVAGAARQAMAVLEMALLDLEGQLAKMPLHRLWGQAADSIRAYASGGWRHLEPEALTRFARRCREQGFHALKIQIGLTPQEDVARLQAVRDAVGPGTDLMVDANQRIPLDSAVEWIDALRPFAPVWVEEPISAEDHGSLADLRRASPVPIAAGESETEPSELADLIARDAVDVIQPDMYRVGLRATRAICEQGNVATMVVAPHMAHELSAHVLCGMAEGAWLEYFNWFEDWWETPVCPVSGNVTPSLAAGHGLRLRPGWLEAHRV